MNGLTHVFKRRNEENIHFFCHKSLLKRKYKIILEKLKGKCQDGMDDFSIAGLKYSTSFEKRCQEMKRVFQAETFCKSKKNIAASFIFVQDNKNGCFVFLGVFQIETFSENTMN